MSMGIDGMVPLDIEVIKSFTSQEQVQAYKIYKESQIEHLRVKMKADNQKYFTERLSKVILKVVGIISALMGALTVYIETFLL